MDPRIEALESTTFYGKRLTRKQIALMQETVALFPKDSRRELARTLCENFNWHTPSGTFREQFCLRVLEALEDLGILTLPARRDRGGRRGPPVRTAASDPGAPISEPLRDLEPITLEIAAGGEDMAEWTEIVDRYHPRGYRAPIGCHLAYFVVDAKGRRLGCLMFESARALPARDAWIGWTDRERDAGLLQVVLNSRFLVLPWVTVRNLASRSLSLAARRVAEDWHRRWGVRPLLAETFIDPQEHDGGCYRASGWTRIGATASRAPKDVYMLELAPDARAVLRCDAKSDGGRKAPPKARAPKSAETVSVLWSKIAAAAAKTADRHDRVWRVRRRTIGTFLVVLFVLRLVFGSGRNYSDVLADLWEGAHKTGVALPQERPVTPSAMSRARAKVDPEVFKDLHRAILDEAPERPLWKRRRIFAIDGSKINLPRVLLKDGYAPPGSHTPNPQGLVSCLYELASRLPFDFSLNADTNERRVAHDHLKTLSAGDVVVYDRGYYSYEMLLAHISRGQDAVFRLKRDANAETVAFLAGALNEVTVEVRPGKKALTRLRACDPDTVFKPLKMRLIRYTAGDTVFALGTTLSEEDGFSVGDLAEIYKERWRIEEHYKTAKWFLALDSFNAETERGVLQELYANFVMITATRLMTDVIDQEINGDDGAEGRGPRKRVNFKSAVTAVFRNLEALALTQADAVAETITRMVENIVSLWQSERPGRSYPRISLKPKSKWSRKGKVARAR